VFREAGVEIAEMTPEDFDAWRALAQETSYAAFVRTTRRPGASRPGARGRVILSGRAARRRPGPVFTFPNHKKENEEAVWLAKLGAAARTGNNPFLKGVAFLSLLSGWTAAGLIVARWLITCQMIFVRFVLNQSTIWQTEAVIYMMIAATHAGPALRAVPARPCERGPHPAGPADAAAQGAVLRHHVAAIAIIASWLFYGYEYWHFAWERNWRSDTVWGVRLWIPYLALPIGFGSSSCN
jgi:TRAP-type C4-dicarboxylate transport system permease small subunit